MIPDLKDTIYFTIFELSTYVWFIILVFILLYLYESIKPYKVPKEIENIKSIPSDLGIIELSNLFNRKLNINTLAAYAQNLINRGLLKIQIIDDKEFIIKNDYDKRPSISDAATINLLLNIMGDGDRVTIDNLKNFSQSKRNRNILLTEWSLWCKIMKKENYRHIFFEPKTHYGLIKFMSYFGVFIFFINIIFKLDFNLCYYSFLPSIILSILFSKIYKRTYPSNIEYHKWLSFKKYLENIEISDDITSVEDYIIYGTCLGVHNIESKLTKHDYCFRITDALNSTISKAIWDGNRRVF